MLTSDHLRRFVLGSYLAIGLFLLAHGLNAFVVDSLAPPMFSLRAPSDSQKLDRAATPSAQYVSQIQSSGLFYMPSAPMGIPLPGESGQQGRSSLGVASKLRLIGLVTGDDRHAFAIVEELGARRQVLYRLHDQIPEIGEVSEIRPDGIVVRSGNLQELLELSVADKPVAGAPAVTTAGAQSPGSPLKKVVDRREVEQAMADLPKLLTQARAVPHMVNGAPSGYRMDYIAPASFYEKIGIQYGDVLQRVNGVDVRDPSTMLSLFQQLKNERTVKVDMIRNNQRVTMTYELR